MWLTAPGLPQDAPRPDPGDLGSVAQLAAAAVAGTLPTKQAVRAWTPWHWIHFLRSLPLRPVDPQAAKVLADLDAAFALTATTNAEVLAEWLVLAALHGHAPAEPRTREFLATVGRRKYLVPIYAALLRTAAGERLARELYPQVRPGYHALTRTALDPMLTWPKDQADAGLATVVTPAADP
jgi:leukotriene-A4 hydrolase